MNRLYTKSEVELLLQFQALQKAENVCDMLVNIGIMHISGAVPAQLAVSKQGQAILTEMERVRAELLPREEEIKALVAEFVPAEGKTNENQEETN